MRNEMPLLTETEQSTVNYRDSIKHFSFKPTGGFHLALQEDIKAGKRNSVELNTNISHYALSSNESKRRIPPQPNLVKKSIKKLNVSQISVKKP